MFCYHWGVCQLVLILSHWNAGVESECSVNWDIGWKSEKTSRIVIR